MITQSHHKVGSCMILTVCTDVVQSAGVEGNREVKHDDADSGVGSVQCNDGIIYTDMELLGKLQQVL